MQFNASEAYNFYNSFTIYNDFYVYFTTERHIFQDYKTKQNCLNIYEEEFVLPFRMLF